MIVNLQQLTNAISYMIFSDTNLFGAARSWIKRVVIMETWIKASVMLLTQTILTITNH